MITSAYCHSINTYFNVPSGALMWGNDIASTKVHISTQVLSKTDEKIKAFTITGMKSFPLSVKILSLITDADLLFFVRDDCPYCDRMKNDYIC